MSIERLKFRGKACRRIETFKDGKSISTEKGTWIFSADKSLSRFFGMVESGLIDPATIGQWTGLVDSKGVEVYEGDELGGNYGNGYVKWCDECKSFQYYAPMDMPECFGCVGDLHWNEIVDDKENIEVIGNVHEVTT